MVASESGDRTYLLDLLKEPVLAVQDFFLLTGRALRNIFRTPHYGDDIVLQMDTIGVGSLPIVVMTGFFSGAVMALQMSRALANYGQVGKTGTLVSLTLVRELGPVLTAIMVAGRNASGIASELGSMKVTEQIDAMRALGTDPMQKLVTPRLIATCVMLPLLTIIADFVGMFGGFMIAKFFLAIDSRAILDHRLARAGVERRGAGAAQAVDVRVDRFPDRLLLRPAHHRRHAGRGPLHHAGGGGGHGADLRAGSADHQDLRQPGGTDGRGTRAVPVLRFEHVTVSFDGELALRGRLLRSVRRRIARHPGRGRAAARRCCSRPRWGWCSRIPARSSSSARISPP